VDNAGGAEDEIHGSDAGEGGDQAPGPEAAEDWNTRIYRVWMEVPKPPPGPTLCDDGREAEPTRPLEENHPRATARAGGGAPRKEKKKRAKVPPRKEKSGRWH
jgi:hypothetical protein